MSIRFLDHTGDTAVEVCGADAPELFREAGRALTELYVDVEQGAPVEVRAARELRLEAEDGESLLIDFLNELIYLFDTEGFLCAGLKVAKLSLEPPAVLEARVEGESFDPERHCSLTEVKAATFHGAEIRSAGAGLCVAVVFDL